MTSLPHILGQEHLTLADIHYGISSSSPQYQASSEGLQKVQQSRSLLEELTDVQKKVVYGVNTGFGSLAKIQIEQSMLTQLQENLLKSHASGHGKPVPDAVVKAMLILKVHSLLQGHSGVSIELIHGLLALLNDDVYPVVYEKGSLGASGDLAPLAHLCLPLIGLGEVHKNGKVLPVADQTWMAPYKVKLKSKEGLALINGTQYMCAYGIVNLLQADCLLKIAHWCAALSIEGYQAKHEPLSHGIHQARNHHGQILSASWLRTLLQDSPLPESAKKQVQDPYAFRCTPQVLGASIGALEHVKQVFESEANSVTDNPLVFADSGEVLSGGNFHGQALALASDYLKMAMAEVGSISERRTFNLMLGKNDLPEFLVASPGINSGLMIAQYLAAALVSDNKQKATPASTDSVTSSNGQEDHVSMGANSVVQCAEILQQLESILAIEWLSASQALYLRSGAKTAPLLEQKLATYRTQVPPISDDVYMKGAIDATIAWMQSQNWDIA